MKDKLPQIPAVKKLVQVENPDDYVPPKLVALIDEGGKPKHWCKHEHIRIWPHHRVIKCRDCQADIDPYTYLLEVGQDENRKLSELNYLRWEVKRYSVQIEELKKQIAKLKKEVRCYDGRKTT